MFTLISLSSLFAQRFCKDRATFYNSHVGKYQSLFGKHQILLTILIERLLEVFHLLIQFNYSDKIKLRESDYERRSSAFLEVLLRKSLQGMLRFLAAKFYLYSTGFWVSMVRYLSVCWTGNRYRSNSSRFSRDRVVSWLTEFRLVPVEFAFILIKSFWTGYLFFTIDYL